MNKKNESFICFSCGGEMNHKKVEQTFTIDEYSLTLRGLQAHVCNICDERIYSYEETYMIQSLVRALKQTSAQKPDILNLDETANLLRVSNQTIYNMIKDGRLKAYKVGREWRIMQKDIESFIPGVSSNNVVETTIVAAKGGEIDSADANIIMDLMKEALLDE